MDVKSFDQSHANVLVPSDEGPGSARPDLDVSIAGLTYNGEGHEAEPPPRDNTNVATKPNQASAAGAYVSRLILATICYSNVRLLYRLTVP